MKNIFGVGQKVEHKNRTVTIQSVGMAKDGRVYYYDTEGNNFWETEVEPGLPNRHALLKSYLIKRGNGEIDLTNWTTEEPHRFISPDDELLDTREKHIEF